MFKSNLKYILTNLAIVLVLLFATSVTSAHAMYVSDPVVEQASRALMQAQYNFVAGTQKPEMVKNGAARNFMRFLAKVSHAEKELKKAQIAYNEAIVTAKFKNANFKDLDYVAPSGLDEALSYWQSVKQEAGTQTILEAEKAFEGLEFVY